MGRCASTCGLCIAGIILVVVVVALPISARAQEQPTTGGVTRDTTTAAEDDAAWRQRMEARMQQLEQENARLREQVGDVAETQQAVMKDAQERGILTVEGGQPRLTTPDFFDVNKYAAEGDFPGSFRIPGTKTSFQIGGYVQLDAIFDGDKIGNN